LWDRVVWCHAKLLSKINIIPVTLWKPFINALRVIKAYTKFISMIFLTEIFLDVARQSKKKLPKTEESRRERYATLQLFLFLPKLKHFLAVKCCAKFFYN